MNVHTFKVSSIDLKAKISLYSTTEQVPYESAASIFLLMDHFLYRFSTFREQMMKIYRLEV